MRPTAAVLPAAAIPVLCFQQGLQHEPVQSVQSDVQRTIGVMIRVACRSEKASNLTPAGSDYHIAIT